MGEFTENFSKEFQSATPEEFGSAAFTEQEFNSLRGMYNEAREKLGDNASRESIKGEVLRKISLGGWKQPKDLSSDDLVKEVAQSAITHACVIAESLIREKGEESAYDAYFSYTTKNQWDRFVYLNLLKLGKRGEDSGLKKEWFSLDKRDINNLNPRVNYPELIDSHNIYGVGKPLRYLPAQLMGNIEKMRIQSPEDNEKYGIAWKSFEEVLKQSASLEDLSIGIAMYVVEEYLKRGIDEDEIVDILLKGYNPRGPMKEHGYLKSVDDLWKRILSNLEKGSEHEKRMGNKLEPLVQERIKEGLPKRERLYLINISKNQVEETLKKTFPATWNYPDIAPFFFAFSQKVGSLDLSPEEVVESLKESVKESFQKNEDDQAFFIYTLLKFIQNLPVQKEMKREIFLSWKAYSDNIPQSKFNKRVIRAIERENSSKKGS